MKDLLKLAHDRLSYIQDALEVTLEKLSMDKSEFQIVPGMAVPTSSPRELLIRLLIHHPISQAEMASAGVRPFLGKSSSLDTIHISHFFITGLSENGLSKI